MYVYVYVCMHIQFYDHMFDWNLKQEISTLSAILARNGIHAGSKLRILVADADAYVAVVDEKVMVKIGTRYDVSNVIPSDFHPAAHGKDYCVWEKGSLGVPAGRRHL